MHRIFLVIGLTLAAAFAGCRQNVEPPDPGFTRVSPSAGAGSYTQNQGDFVGNDSILSAGQYDDTLQPRGAGDSLDNLEDAEVYGSVYFDFDKSYIRPADQPLLEEMASYLANNPNRTLAVVGHCDWRGTTEYNMALGDRRANAVKQYLLQLGVDGGRIQTVSKGDLEAETDAPDSQAAQDRRGDLLLLD
ncbi:MAG: OmpA family protein [Verrucomicrobiota bacterium JB022]|nr:OmpA family protein [Verrucomicrobiota bacterium JB022]